MPRPKPKDKNFMYVITSPVNEQMSRYKIGLTDDITSIRKSYQTALVDVKIVYTCNRPDSRDIEKQILSDFGTHRVKNEHGNPTKWLHVDRTALIRRIEELCGDTQCLIPLEVMDSPYLSTGRNRACCTIV